MASDGHWQDGQTTLNVHSFCEGPKRLGGHACITRPASQLPYHVFTIVLILPSHNLLPSTPSKHRPQRGRLTPRRLDASPFPSFRPLFPPPHGAFTFCPCLVDNRREQLSPPPQKATELWSVPCQHNGKPTDNTVLLVPTLTHVGPLQAKAPHTLT